MFHIPSRVSLPIVAALIASGWVALFLVLDGSGEDPWVWILVPLCFVASVVLPQVYVVATVIMLLAGFVAAWMGLGYGEIELLLPIAYLMGYIGRHSRSVIFGAATVIALAAVTALRVDAPWFATLVSIGVYGTAWAFGWIVRQRAIAATAAARESALLAAVDLEEIVAESAFTASERATSRALAVLRDAVRRMCLLTGSACNAGPPYAPDDVSAIRGEGERAIDQLHETLMMLEASGDEAARGAAWHAGPDEHADDLLEDSASDSSSWRWVRPVALGLLLVVSVAAPVLLGELKPTLLIAAIALPLCAWFVRRLPVAAGAVAAVTQLGAALGPSFSPDTMLPMGVAFCVIVWELNSVPLLSARLAMFAAIAAALFLGAQFGVRGFGFMIVSTMLPLAAARAWREHDMILHDEQVRAAKLMSGIAAATRRAARVARQRLARELHDGVSHGITAMTLQAAAAQAIGDRDHEHAVRCMGLAQEVGEQTLREIDALARERHEDAVGHSAGLDALIEGARVAGLRVAQTDIAQPAESDRLTYRIVQEALTNVSRYAPGGRIDITAGVRGTMRFVRVVDDGAAGNVASSGAQRALEQLGLGSGLAGLEARIREREGTFRAGPQGRGFEVFAQWPESEAGAVVASGGAAASTASASAGASATSASGNTSVSEPATVKDPTGASIATSTRRNDG